MANFNLLSKTEHFQAIKKGKQKHELRKVEELPNIKVGDHIILTEVGTGKKGKVEVTYISPPLDWSGAKGYILVSIDRKWWENIFIK